MRRSMTSTDSGVLFERVAQFAEDLIREMKKDADRYIAQARETILAAERGGGRDLSAG